MNPVMPQLFLSLLIGFGTLHGQTRVSQSEVVVDGVQTFCRTFKSAAASDHPVLLIALHGDAPFAKPGYQYAFAQRVAKGAGNTVAVGLLRPGYTDPDGRTSDGERGEAVGDNYDAPRVNQIATAIGALKDFYNPKYVFLVGHSGGSAITAILIASHPNLVDHAFIVSCPCDINQWRESMLALTKQPVFKGPLQVTSPHEMVSKIPPSTQITVFVGKEDAVTKPELSLQYTKALAASGLEPDFHLIEGDHEILLSNAVISEVAKAIDLASQDKPPEAK